MPLTPGYGETPVTDDEADALLPQARELLGEPITKADVYDLEQAVQEEVAEELVTAVLDGALTVDELLTDHYVRDLHRRLYGDIWTWAGIYRKRELNIGVAPEMIAVELRGSLETIRYRWQHTDDWIAHELGIAAHAEAVRIHPFTDGNGRTTRLLADLLFLAAQDAEPPQRYFWDLDKPEYIARLRQYDQSRDPRSLAGFIEIRALGE
ncbi:Fic family protein [Microbacterium ulmi]|uniref:Cell filamentation protein Fic n=1 Tax=Microbacterium ulmi TaxID=179095 RepID=A0A7Y2LZY5_9MICO|nr:Fic family protein [Microbacterium ulmi]NII71279.1 fido (protein-threonine AMPylation protein) [Microbacterium ulmi]NNH02583.1 cell filamentation protein Fic [Microbacterium ulmi]